MKKVEEAKVPDPDMPVDPDADPYGASPEKPQEPEEEEVFIPPVERVLWYDFDAFDGKDPVLLALMRIELGEEEE